MNLEFIQTSLCLMGIFDNEFFWSACVCFIFFLCWAKFFVISRWWNFSTYQYTRVQTLQQCHYCRSGKITHLCFKRYERWFDYLFRFFATYQDKTFVVDLQRPLKLLLAWTTWIILFLMKHMFISFALITNGGLFFMLRMHQVCFL